MKNPKITLLDRDQIVSRMYDEDHDANRVIIVGSDMSEIGETIKSSLKTSLENLKVDMNQAPMETKIERIEVPVIVKELEIREVEKQVIVEKPQIITIERPVVTTKTEVVTVEKTVVVSEPKILQFEKPVINSKLLTGLLVVQTITLVLLALAVLLK